MKLMAALSGKSEPSKAQILLDGLEEIKLQIQELGANILDRVDRLCTKVEAVVAGEQQNGD